MKILIDTNIILDLLLDRKPYSRHSEELFKFAESGQVKAFLTANSVTDIVYILRKAYDMETIRSNLIIMFEFIKILNVSASDISRAFEIESNDFEDAVVIQCAARIGAEYIITRNKEGFRKSQVKSLTAKDFIELILNK